MHETQLTNTMCVFVCVRVYVCVCVSVFVFVCVTLESLVDQSP